MHVYDAWKISMEKTCGGECGDDLWRRSVEIRRGGDSRTRLVNKKCRGGMEVMSHEAEECFSNYDI